VDAPWCRPIALDSPGVSCSAREKSQPRNGPGEIFVPAAAEMARSNRLCRNPLYDTGPLTPENTPENWPPGKTITRAIANTWQVAGGPGFEPGLTESESAMSVVRSFGYKERRRQIRQSRTNNCQWRLVSAASVSWRAILRALPTSARAGQNNGMDFRAPQSSSFHARSGERFEGPGRSPLWHLWPFGPLPLMSSACR
jgi:hypothetical protein